MGDLDDPSVYYKLDPTNQRERIIGLPKQSKIAWDAGLALQLPDSYYHIDRVVITGMGGSAIGGDLIADILAGLNNAPKLLIYRGYHLPSFINNRTLVICSSHSGQTEEVLSTFQDAVRLESKPIVITQGGKLAAMAKQSLIPMLSIPNTWSEPRFALGYGLFAPLALISKIFPLPRDVVNRIPKTITKWESDIQNLAQQVPTSKNQAKKLAQKLSGKVVAIRGGPGFAAVARRWKTQFNEEAKTWAFWETEPTSYDKLLVHSALLERSIKKIHLLILQAKNTPKNSHYRTSTTTTIPQEELQFKGNTHLEQVLNGISMGDFTSYYLAMLNNIDPSPVPSLDLLKNMMSSRSR